MSMCNCNCSCPCTIFAIVVSAILGVIAAFLQIAGVFTATVMFPMMVLVIAVVYLGILAATSAICPCEAGRCRCSALTALLVGILGSILFSAILLALGIVATSVLSAVLVGLVVFFAALTFGSTACYVRIQADCGN